MKEQLGLCALADVHVLNYRQLVGWLVWWVVARLQKIAFEGMVVMVADVSVLNTIFAIMF